MNYPSIILKPKRSESIRRKHPWVFSGAISKVILSEEGSIAEGDLVQVCDNEEKCIGIGHFGEGSIAVRMLSFKEELIDVNFWVKKVQAAYDLRDSLGFISNETTSTFRLVHAEGDGLPGLIIDIYNKVAVIQAHSLGMAKALNDIAAALKKVFGNTLEAVYSKSEQSLHRQGTKEYTDAYILGDSDCPQVVLENSLQFEINWITGQKTGFFIDQRENRKLLQQFVKGKKVLNTFCYSGGFSIYALAAGAELVHSVDSSEKAIELTDRNIQLNFNEQNNHKSFSQDTFSFLSETEEKYDVIILDPPAYAKSKNAKHKAVQGYKRLNEKAMRLIKAGGFLMTFSCSQVIDRKLFEDTITAAAISAKKNIKILHHLSQPADHPVNIFHPEGEYLKGLILYIEE